MKKYYIQVTDAESVQQIQDAGISKDCILCVDDYNLDATKKRIVSAIYKVTGVSFDQIRCRSGTRYNVNARIMYVYFCALAGYSRGAISNDLKRDERRSRWYLENAKDRYEGDIEFRRDIEAVEDILHLTKKSTASKIVFYRSATKIRKKRKK